MHALASGRTYPHLTASLKDISKDYKIDFVQGRLIGLQPHANIAYISSTDTTSSSSTIDSIRPISYDAIVLCTGAGYTAPIRPHIETISKPATTLVIRAQDISAYYNQLKAASTILITGGGLIGVELAGEIVTRMGHNSDGSRKKIIFLTNSKLLSTLPIKAGKLALAWLTANIVEVIENDTIQSITTDNIKNTINQPINQSPPTVYHITTHTGRYFDVNLHIDCTGSRPHKEVSEISTLRDSTRMALLCYLDKHKVPYSLPTASVDDVGCHGSNSDSYIKSYQATDETPSPSSTQLYHYPFTSDHKGDSKSKVKPILVNQHLQVYYILSYLS